MNVIRGLSDVAQRHVCQLSTFLFNSRLYDYYNVLDVFGV